MDTMFQKTAKWIDNDMVLANWESLHFWAKHVLWTWQWWLELALAILPVVSWIMLRKKDSTSRLLYAGFFVLAISMWLDFIGNSYGLWYYPYKLLPSLPPFFPMETFIPVEVMFLLQYWPTASSWIKATLLGASNSFVAEPLTKWMGLYVLLHWQYVYSLPIYMMIYLMAHRLVQSRTFKRLDER